jgi:hypothetical protein
VQGAELFIEFVKFIGSKKVFNARVIGGYFVYGKAPSVVREICLLTQQTQ